MARKVCPPLAGAIDLAATFPWQLGGILALLAYWILHDLAAWLALPAHAAALGSPLAINLAGLPQYIVPGLLLAAASISFLRRGRARGLAAEMPTSPAMDALARMSLHDFEKLVAEGFRREGFLVVERTAPNAGCVDLELFMGRDRYLVQCSRWKESAVDAHAVRELYAAIVAERAVGGFIVTSGRFTDEARKFALGRAIRLVPADSLRRLIKKVTASSSGELSISPVFARRRHDIAPPACPKCGKVMMARSKKQGGTFVQIDWSCTSFPACQGSRRL